MKTTNQSSNGRQIAIIAMFFIFAMISFVTNLAAPIGTIWGYKFAGDSFLGMMGNMMNFAAYLFMGIPAGKLLVKIGYKKTALYAMAVGVVGLFVQYLSSVIGADTVIYEKTITVTEKIGGENVEMVRNFGVTLNFFIYLLGAFICGFCVCMLNTVVNPMLNLLGGGGNKGNQLIQTGGALNSLSATLTPFFVGALIGVLSPKTQMGDVAILLWIAIAIFIAAFVIISFVAIPEPNKGSGSAKVKYLHSPWNFRHTVLGVIAIFFYVGIEIGIPGTLNFYLADQNSTGAEVLGDASTIAGAVVAIYWLLMLVGRALSSAISGKISTRTQLLSVSVVGIVLTIAAICSPKSSRMDVPSFLYNPVESVQNTLSEANMPQTDIDAFISNPTVEALEHYTTSEQLVAKNGETVTRTVIANTNKQPYELVNALKSTPTVPISAIFLIICGLCTSVMWGGIFNLAVEGLGKYTAQASGIFMMMVVGGGIMPLVQQKIAGAAGYMPSYWLIAGMLGYILFYALIGCKNVNKDIPVDDEITNSL
ncbi:MFS transporter [uncultured Muribaculum sp.]|uniref:MFS transporter n=1 Tax=uncultured Muribaculum sp. TaxID=1918613 RepID=UPI0025B0830A|nr:MFS transporter [uncultured Muribaculum sp.]